MKRILMIAASGALALASLTACSAEGAGTDFCDVAQNFNPDDFEFAELADADMEAALAGDMSGINAWGENAAGQIDDIIAELKRAKGGAPSPETVKALEDVIAGFDVVKGLATSAANADDFMSFAAEMQAMTDDFSALDESMTSAGDVLDDATVKYCN
jgi:hypothetical protein